MAGLRVPTYESRAGMAGAAPRQTANYQGIGTFQDQGAAGEARGMEQLAQGMHKLGGTMFGIGIHERQEQLAAELVKDLQDYTARSQAFHDEYSDSHKFNNAQDAEQQAMTFHDSELSTLREKWGNNKAALRHIEQQGGNIANSGINALRDYGRAQRDLYKGQVNDTGNAMLAKLAEDPNVTDEQIAIARRDRMNEIRAMYPGGDTGAKEIAVDDHIKKARWNAEVQRYTGMDPNEALRMIKGGGSPRAVSLPQDIADMATREAERQGVDPSLVHAVIHQESRGRADAVSPAGARGLMQLMPATAKGLGVNPDDPADNVRGGVTYLKKMLDRYDGDQQLALMAYNWGPGNVDSYVKTGKGLNGSSVPEETQKYVPAILNGRYPGLSSWGDPTQQQALVRHLESAARTQSKEQREQAFTGLYQQAFEQAKDMPDNQRDASMASYALSLPDPAARKAFLENYKHDKELYKAKQDATDAELRLRTLDFAKDKPRTEVLQQVDALRKAGMSEDGLTSLRKELFEGPQYSDPSAVDDIHAGIMSGLYQTSGDVRRAMDSLTINQKDRTQLLSQHEKARDEEYKDALKNITGNLEAMGISDKDKNGKQTYQFAFSNYVAAMEKELGRRLSRDELNDAAHKITLNAVTSKGFFGGDKETPAYKAMQNISVDDIRLHAREAAKAGYPVISPERVPYEYNRPDVKKRREESASLLAPKKKDTGQSDEVSATDWDMAGMM